MFLWRASSGSLATGQNIYKRLKDRNIECLRCGSSPESDKHIFFECPESQEVWKELDISLIIKRKGFCSFKDWFTTVMEEAELVAIALWLIWKSRNEWIFEGASKGAKKICNYSRALLNEFQATQMNKMDSSCYQNQNGSISSWKPPAEDLLKINVDAAFLNG